MYMTEYVTTRYVLYFNNNDSSYKILRRRDGRICYLYADLALEFFMEFEPITEDRGNCRLHDICIDKYIRLSGAAV
jgi:hypothetical protein